MDLLINCVFRLSNFDEGSFEKQTYSKHTMNWLISKLESNKE